MYETEIALLDDMLERLKAIEEPEDETIRVEGFVYSHHSGETENRTFEAVPKPLTQTRFRAVLRGVAKSIPDEEGSYRVRNAYSHGVKIWSALLGLSQSKAEFLWDMVYWRWRKTGRTPTFYVPEDLAKILRKVKIDLLMVSKCVDCTMDELRVALLERIQVWKELFRPAK